MRVGGEGGRRGTTAAGIPGARKFPVLGDTFADVLQEGRGQNCGVGEERRYFWKELLFLPPRLLGSLEVTVHVWYTVSKTEKGELLSGGRKRKLLQKMKQALLGAMLRTEGAQRAGFQ